MRARPVGSTGRPTLRSAARPPALHPRRIPARPIGGHRAGPRSSSTSSPRGSGQPTVIRSLRLPRRCRPASVRCWWPSRRRSHRVGARPSRPGSLPEPGDLRRGRRARHREADDRRPNCRWWWPASHSRSRRTAVRSAQ
ncbi:hypothetical protein SDC9_155494 [bioreactor metagenome]|uniref:Uncharacterized protein n=1 Tax=bioreactor metagenome TaxID=1076179 RepID=A0A645F3V8_9ZZZZ